MTLESTTIDYINGFTYLSCQTAAEANAASNTGANLLYNSQSRTQGNFIVYYSFAQEQFDHDIEKYGLPDNLTDEQKARAYAYLCQHYFEMKFKSWDAVAISQGGDSVTKSRPTTTGWQNYAALLREYRGIGQDVTTTELEKHTDSDNYPAEFKDSQLASIEIKFEDPQ